MLVATLLREGTPPLKIGSTSERLEALSIQFQHRADLYAESLKRAWRNLNHVARCGHTGVMRQSRPVRIFSFVGTFERFLRHRVDAEHTTERSDVGNVDIHDASVHPEASRRGIRENEQHSTILCEGCNTTESLLPRCLVQCELQLKRLTTDLNTLGRGG